MLLYENAVLIKMGPCKIALDSDRDLIRLNSISVFSLPWKESIHWTFCPEMLFHLFLMGFTPIHLSDLRSCISSFRKPSLEPPFIWVEHLTYVFTVLILLRLFN